MPPWLHQQLEKLKPALEEVREANRVIDAAALRIREAMLQPLTADVQAQTGYFGPDRPKGALVVWVYC